MPEQAAKATPSEPLNAVTLRTIVGKTANSKQFLPPRSQLQGGKTAVPSGEIGKYPYLIESAGFQQFGHLRRLV